jgi:hypothetical protein
MATRRKFLAGSVSAVAGVLATSTSARSATEVESSVSETTSLCGEWFFRADPDNAGVQQKWYDGHARGEGWRIVSVPHTSQVEAPLVDYRGVAWYWLSFELSATGTPQSPRDCAVRVEFEAVFHTATVWVNGPIWMGESGENNDDWIAQFVKTLEKNNIGWAFWPYKKMEKSSAVVSILPPADWAKIVEFAKLPRGTGQVEERLKARPDQETIVRAFDQFLENMRLQKCIVNAGYLKALGLKSDVAPVTAGGSAK